MRTGRARRCAPRKRASILRAATYGSREQGAEATGNHAHGGRRFTDVTPESPLYARLLYGRHRLRVRAVRGERVRTGSLRDRATARPRAIRDRRPPAGRIRSARQAVVRAAEGRDARGCAGPGPVRSGPATPPRRGRGRWVTAAVTVAEARARAVRTDRGESGPGPADRGAESRDGHGGRSRDRNPSRSISRASGSGRYAFSPGTIRGVSQPPSQ